MDDESQPGNGRARGLAAAPLQETLPAKLVLLPPVVERLAVRVSEFRYGVGDAVVEPNEGLDGLPSLLSAVHPCVSPGPVLVKDFHRSSFCRLLLDEIPASTKEL